MHGLQHEPIGLVCCGLKGKTDMNALSAGAVLSARYAGLKQKQINDDASIENTVGNTNNNTSIKLPQAIKALINSKDFWVNAKTNRYKKLILEEQLDKLLELKRDFLGIM